MTHHTDRRTFLKESLTLGTAAVLGAGRIPDLFGQAQAPAPALAVVKGTDYLANTRRAVELLGGMGKFVSKGARVGLLVNAPQWWRLPGSHTNTDVVLAVIRMCREAGARDIQWLFVPSSDIWTRSPRSAGFSDDIKSLTACSGRYADKDVKGLALKKVRVIQELFSCDVFINIPIAKNHEGTHFSNCLKNFMGSLTEPSFRFFHFGSGTNKGEYDNVDFLSQCIADVNLLRKPDLCVADATVVLGTNGPAGPGELLRPQKVVAGRDPVAVDAYCAGLLGLKPAEVLMIRKAAGHGLGTMDLGTLSIKEVAA